MICFKGKEKDDEGLRSKVGIFLHVYFLCFFFLFLVIILALFTYWKLYFFFKVVEG